VDTTGEQFMDTITILCRNEQPVDFNLEGVGKLSIRVGCNGYSVSAILQASNMITSNITLGRGLAVANPPST
jgi:hypothetical protein